MLKLSLVFSLFALTALDGSAQWGKPSAPVIPEADRFVNIPRAAVPIQKKRIYRAAYDATRAASDLTKLLPALNMAGSGLTLSLPPAYLSQTQSLLLSFTGPPSTGSSMTSITEQSSVPVIPT